MAAYNPYPIYQANAYQPYPQTSQAYVPPVSQAPVPVTGMCWVDGEVGAKAQQLPPGWDTTKPFPMWDTNDQIIYLKSFNAMGMPNPLTKLHYTIEEPQQSHQAQSVSAQPALPQGDGDYVKKADLERLKEELKAAITAGKEGGARNAKSSV